MTSPLLSVVSMSLSRRLRFSVLSRFCFSLTVRRDDSESKSLLARRDASPSQNDDDGLLAALGELQTTKLAIRLTTNHISLEEELSVYL